MRLSISLDTNDFGTLYEWFLSKATAPSFVIILQTDLRAWFMDGEATDLEGGIYVLNMVGMRQEWVMVWGSLAANKMNLCRLINYLWELYK